jgi:hypothetical protein
VTEVDGITVATQRDIDLVQDGREDHLTSLAAG